jgi:hypothetical protein
MTRLLGKCCNVGNAKKTLKDAKKRSFQTKKKHSNNLRNYCWYMDARKDVKEIPTTFP